MHVTHLQESKLLAGVSMPPVYSIALAIMLIFLIKCDEKSVGYAYTVKCEDALTTMTGKVYKQCLYINMNQMLIVREGRGEREALE